ncbi:hypothetical protein EVAR_54669_1 [Eumeta japonica]|uniref:Uncharacterized protein n=1 Tax=Eumeta variegata TaxID=151549 RepID=A0A4C1X9E1_EUMVA|nr:hypothetical protein EVAR_54669_1 [Eumeta japonica]
MHKKGLQVLLVSHTARTEQKLASAVMTHFEDWVDKNEKYLSVCNLALISMPEKQRKEDEDEQWSTTGWTKLNWNQDQDQK